MMKTLVTAVSIVTTAGSAFAGEAEGVVSNYDPATRMIVLETGEAFRLAEGIEPEGLQPGGNVVVTYDDGTTDATSVAITK